MHNVYKSVLLCLFIVFLSCPYVIAGAAQTAAIRAAKNWLVLVDTGNYGTSWDNASELFKKSIARDMWQQSIETVRPPMGNLKSRNLISATYTRALPGAPDGEYVVIRFQSSFANKKSAIETVTPMKDPDGSWRVSGYFIK